MRTLGKYLRPPRFGSACRYASVLQKKLPDFAIAPLRGDYNLRRFSATVDIRVWLATCCMLSFRIKLDKPLIDFANHGETLSSSLERSSEPLLPSFWPPARHVGRRKRPPPRDPSAGLALEECRSTSSIRISGMTLFPACVGREKACAGSDDPAFLVFARREVAKQLTSDGGRRRRVSQLGPKSSRGFSRASDERRGRRDGFFNRHRSSRRRFRGTVLRTDLNFEDGVAKGADTPSMFGSSNPWIRIVVDKC